jgi:hypothetical protein
LINAQQSHTQHNFITTLLNIGLLITVLVVALVTADFFIHQITRVPSRYLKQIIRVDDQLAPETRLGKLLDETLVGAFGEFTFRVTTDEDGFRTSIAPQPLEGDNPSIIMLGDSQLFGIGVSDEHTVSSLLSNEIKTAVLNSACPGYSTIEQYELSRELLAAHKPEYLVLTFFSGNDPYENFLHRRRLEPATHSNTDVLAKQKRQPLIPWVKQELSRHSSIYNLAIRLRQYPTINNLLYQFGLLSAEKPGELIAFEVARSETQDKLWQVTEDVILKIAALAKQYDTELIVALIPDRFQVDTTYWDKWIQKYQLNPDDFDLNAPNRHVSQFANAQNLKFIDFTEPLRANEATSGNTYWKIDNHLSHGGNRVIAKTLAQYLNTRFPTT